MMTRALLLLTLAFALPCVAQRAFAGDEWLTDFDAATKLAEKTNRPILADFTGSDWCFYCKKLSKEVFATAEFKAWAKKRVVLLQIDFPNAKQLPAELAAQNEKLKLRYGVEAFPTTLFLSAEGKVLGRYGYEPGGAKNWLENADEILAKAKADGKLVLADFTGSDWCGWCVRLEREVFETDAFKAWAKKNVVLLVLDFPKGKLQSRRLRAQNQALAEKYEIQGFPTILLLDPKTGKSVGELGYMRGGPKVWIDAAETLMR